MSRSIQTIEILYQLGLPRVLGKLIIDKCFTRIFICVLSQDGFASMGHLSSLLQTQTMLTKKYNIDIEHCFLSNENDNARGRNGLVAKFLSTSTFTHILFVNSSIRFDPMSIVRLLSLDRPIIGIPVPKTYYDWNKAAGSAYVNIPPEKLKARASGFQINYSDNRKIINGVVEVKHIGMEITLIKREVFIRMRKEYSHLKYSDDIGVLNSEEDKHLFGFFNCMIKKDKNGKIHYLSDDYAFCERLSELDIKIYLDTGSRVSKRACTNFDPSFLESVQIE